MKKFLLLVFLVPLLIILSGYWFYLNSKAPSSNEDFKNFLIVKGSGASLVGNNLYKAGLIKSPLAFKIYVQVTGKAGKIQAGEYKLTPSYNLFELVNQFGKGPAEIWVTIPEGLRREEIASKFASTLEKDDTFVDDFLNSSKGFEGYLFPDTYLFPKTASASSIVSRMRSTFDSKYSSLTSTTTLTQKEVVTLASLIERETKTKAERPVVAGIIMNRINADWPLQIDASVQYAVGDSGNWWPILTKDDLSISSSFNSYKYPGLPPAPIANPGITSLEAALNPENTDYWYYIHDPEGKIYYAKTLEEHNANIRKYLGK